ncbi:MULTISPECIES: hypothetical protein [Exiguobacterium]|uniref:DUF4352 domain-containing protein n=1 Tax=Exiguobacterium sibiricum (strain DSM 17290 / CCUG 55495 / CIP 109462 / JCM 13490 / 255-15) TaxID=262543 RepID=B1YEJ1_EXIS2|nr:MULTISPECIES: hypothetical protein [Exiguobacterium]ACB62159.1 conserved hypothetical protein [Exiguobacterium sibiricum 255-15]MCT4793390.1 DUF4352 domain-containing protein [Exiguobacterium artemiae]
MKQLVVLLTLGTILSGCGNPVQEAKQPVSLPKQEQVSIEKTAAYVPNPQLPDDRKLTKVDASIADDKGELTLKQFVRPDVTRTIGPIRMKVEEVKVFHARPSYGMIDFFHGFTHDESFDLVKTRVTITNTGNEPVTFNPVAHFKLDTKIEKTIEDDIYLESLAATYAPDETRSGNFGFILEQPLSYVDWLTSDVLSTKRDVLGKGSSLSLRL